MRILMRSQIAFFSVRCSLSNNRYTDVGGELLLTRVSSRNYGSVITGNYVPYLRRRKILNYG